MKQNLKQKRFILAIDKDTDDGLKMLADKYSCSQAQVVRLLIDAAIKEAKKDKKCPTCGRCDDNHLMDKKHLEILRGNLENE